MSKDEEVSVTKPYPLPCNSGQVISNDVINYLSSLTGFELASVAREGCSSTVAKFCSVPTLFTESDLQNLDIIGMIPLPIKPKIVSEEGNRAVLELDGLYPGYGQTIGNSLRRVLLSSLEGAAITSIKIEGIKHEFSTIEGVMENVVELLLNLKQVRFRLHEQGPFTITLSASGETEVMSNDFEMPSQVEMVGSAVHIAALTSKKSKLDIEATVERGRGFVPIEARTKEKVEVGTIALDTAFSPIRHVNYQVENMRIGDRTDYNKVIFHIETDGSLTPLEAFQKSAQILVEQFSAFTEGFVKKEKIAWINTETQQKEHVGLENTDHQEDEIMKIKLDTLKLSSRTLNALREAGIKTVGGLTRKREETLREVGGLGDKGIQEIKKALGNFGITLKQ